MSFYIKEKPYSIISYCIIHNSIMIEGLRPTCKNLTPTDELDNNKVNVIEP